MEVEQGLRFAKQGELEDLKALKIVDHGLEKFVDSRGASLSHYAARGGHVTVLEYLVGEGVSGSARSGVGATPAHDAAATGNADALVWLLKNTSCGTEDRDEGGCTVVHLCALYGHLRAIKWLVTESGASIAEKTKSGALPLHFAATRGDLDTVKFLVEQRPGTVNAQLDSGATAAYLASQEGHIEVLEYLVEEGEVSTKIRCYDGMSCLHAAAQMGHLQCVKWLVESQKLGINDRDFDGATPLHFASGQGHVDVVMWLLEKGAKVSKDSLGGSPLHAAAEHGQLQCVRILLKHGIDSGIEDNDGLTAAQLAELCWQAECAAAIKRRASQIVALGDLRSNELLDSLGTPIYDEVGPRFRHVRDSIRIGKRDSSADGRVSRPGSLPPLTSPPPPPPPPPAPASDRGHGVEEETPSLISTASQTSLDYENILPGMRIPPAPPAPSCAPTPPPPPPVPKIQSIPNPPPPPPPVPLITPNSTYNSKKCGGSNAGSRSSTLTKNKPMNGSYQELDLIAELKAANGMMSLKKTKKREGSSKTVYSSDGSSSSDKSVKKAPTPSPAAQGVRSGPGGKIKPNLTGEYDPKNFLDKVPEKDTSGKDIAPWKKLIIARQLAEKALSEDTERKKIEEEEAKYKNMPAWKRALLEKKGVLEPKSEGKTDIILEKAETKTGSDPKPSSPRTPDRLEVPLPKNSHELDEDGLPLPPWKQDIRAGQTPIQV